MFNLCSEIWRLEVGGWALGSGREMLEARMGRMMERGVDRGMERVMEKMMEREDDGRESHGALYERRNAVSGTCTGYMIQDRTRDRTHAGCWLLYGRQDAGRWTLHGGRLGCNTREWTGGCRGRMREAGWDAGWWTLNTPWTLNAMLNTEGYGRRRTPPWIPPSHPDIHLPVLALLNETWKLIRYPLYMCEGRATQSN